MMASLRTVLLATTFVIRLFAASVGERETLKGVEAVIVDTSKIEDSDITGVDPVVIRNETELKLRSLGIRVIPLEDARALITKASGSQLIEKLKAKRIVALVVSCSTLADGGKLVYTTVLEAAQIVILSSGKPANTITWRSGNFGTVGRRLAKQSIRDNVADSVTEFANDYLAANPR